MDLTTPKSKLDELRGKLYAKAKSEPTFRFYALYDKLHRTDVLLEAFKHSKSKKGAPGVDGQTFEQIEAYGEERWLKELQEQLTQKTYQPQAVRRVLIPKDGGGERPLGIPTIKDRVAQTAAKLILEPIFEADLSDAAYGYRPERSGVQAVEKVWRLLREGRTEVVDADLTQYFDTIPHAELMKCLEKRIADGAVLHLLKLWLKVPVEERDEQNRPKMGGGKHTTQGVPQGGVISPLLANIYINRLLKRFATSEEMERIGARVVNYADDFVVLSKWGAAGALKQIEEWLTKMKLSLNPTKTSVKKAQEEPFVFLGYEFGSMRVFGSKRKYLGFQPSKKAMGQFRENVGQLLRRGRNEPWEEIKGVLNAVLRGWFEYFKAGTSVHRYKHLDEYVYERVRNLMRRRHKLQRDTSRFGYEDVHGELGVLELRKMWRPHALV